MYKEITNMDAVYAALGLTQEALAEVKGGFEKIAAVLPEKIGAKYVKRKMVEFQLEMAVTAVNGDWEADWNNTDQNKYTPWWDIEEDSSKPSGFGLSYDGCDYAYTAAIVGARLVLENVEKVKHMAEYFLAEYEEYYLG